jgi:antitoxin component YwqK of YwqJK toxin-antitoxin module
LLRKVFLLIIAGLNSGQNHKQEARLHKRRNMMSRIVLLSVFLLTITLSVSGQATKGEDGLYYNNDKELFTGIHNEYAEDSLTRIEISVKEGKLDGQTKVYYKSGQLQEIRSFQDGQMHGKWEKWNDQNIRISEANFDQNKKDGKWFVWDDQGTLRYDMTYKKGEKTGTWFMYDETGKLISSKKY